MAPAGEPEGDGPPARDARGLRSTAGGRRGHGPARRAERLSAGAAAELHGQVDAARAAARDGDRAGALRALNRLDAGVRRAEADGELSGDDADALRRGVAQAKAQVRREVPAPAPTPATSETPAPTETAT